MNEYKTAMCSFKTLDVCTPSCCVNKRKKEDTNIQLKTALVYYVAVCMGQEPRPGMAGSSTRAAVQVLALQPVRLRASFSCWLSVGGQFLTVIVSEHRSRCLKCQQK